MAAPWLRTALTTDNFMELTDLDKGTRYSVVLVATTGTEEKSLETDSDVEILKTTGQGWFICFISFEKICRVLVDLNSFFSYRILKWVVLFRFRMNKKDLFDLKWAHT